MIESITNAESLLKIKLKKKRSKCIELEINNNECTNLLKEIYIELKKYEDENLELLRLNKGLKIEIKEGKNERKFDKIIDEYNIQIMVSNGKFKDVNLINEKLKNEKMIIFEELEYRQEKYNELFKNDEMLNLKLIKKEKEYNISLKIILNINNEKYIFKKYILKMYEKFLCMNNILSSYQKNLRICCVIKNQKPRFNNDNKLDDDIFEKKRIYEKYQISMGKDHGYILELRSKKYNFDMIYVDKNDDNKNNHNYDNNNNSAYIHNIHNSINDTTRNRYESDKYPSSSGGGSGLRGGFPSANSNIFSPSSSSSVAPSLASTAFPSSSSSVAPSLASTAFPSFSPSPSPASDRGIYIDIYTYTLICTYVDIYI
jgi:hypothetical protein